MITIHIAPKRSLFILAFSLSLVFSFILTPPAQASFIGSYALNQFTLTNTAADGAAVTPDGGLSIILTGGNNGSGLPGTTDLVLAAAGAGLVKFQYSYSSLDFPGLDFGGYLLGSSFSLLANIDGQSGSAMFAVSSGQLFGFRVGTADNTGEPGILTLSNFTAPTGGSGAGSVPEPGTAVLLLAAAGAGLASRRYLLNRTKKGTGENV